MRSWPHAPSKLVNEPGIFMITAGTYRKAHLFNSDQKLDMLQTELLNALERFSWEPLAWAVFSNHYHLLAKTPADAANLTEFTSLLHRNSAICLNRIDDAATRRVWYRSWDTRITFEKSVMARLAYVHYNAVKHGLVTNPEDYPYCSARWFLREGDTPFVQSVLSFKTDTVNVYDDF